MVDARRAEEQIPPKDPEEIDHREWNAEDPDLEGLLDSLEDEESKAILSVIESSGPVETEPSTESSTAAPVVQPD